MSPQTPAARRPFYLQPFVWLFVLAAVALGVTLALTGGSDDAADSADTVAAGPQTSEVEIMGDALPPLSDPDAAVGQVVPQIVATTLDGGIEAVAPDDGVARVYGFFAHWCPHCQAEVPRVAAWMASTGLPDGVELVTISTSVEPTADNYPPSEWFARENWPTPVIADDTNSSLASAFGLTSFPYWVAVDADGAVVTRVAGELTTEAFEALVATVTP